MNSPEADMNMGARLRIMRIIWAAFLATIFLYALVGFVAHPPTLSWRSLGFAGEGVSVALGLTAAGLYTVGLLAVVLFAPMLLRSFLRRAEQEQKPELVQTGFIIALAVCEAGALIGLLLLFLTGSWNAVTLMGSSALIIVLLRPRREQLSAASYRLNSATNDH